jgi:hypothetical protein
LIAAAVISINISVENKLSKTYGAALADALSILDLLNERRQDLFEKVEATQIYVVGLLTYYALAVRYFYLCVLFVQ